MLKSSLVENKRDISSESSIHRFSGFNLIAKKKTPWLGFILEFTLPEIELETKSAEVLLQCDKFMERVDSMECLLRIYFDVKEQADKLVSELSVYSNVRQSSSTANCIEFYIKHLSYTPTLSKYDYWNYTLSGGGKEANIALSTREKPRDSGLNVKGLLSNKLYGVDNTGNVCVWPAEPLLLHTLLTVPRYTEMVRGKRYSTSPFFTRLYL